MEFIDFHSLIASSTPLLCGCIFISIGLNMIVHFYKFRARSVKIRGNVIAIERYVSQSTRRSQSTFYRPVIEYTYNGQTKKFAGLGTSEILHDINQSVSVLLNISKDGKKTAAILEGIIRIKIGSIFALIGFITLAIYIFGMKGSIGVTIICASTCLGLGYLFSNMLLNFESGSLIRQKEEYEWQPSPDSVLIETASDLKEEISKFNMIGTIIGFILLIAGLGVSTSGYNQIPQEFKALFWNTPAYFFEQITTGSLNSTEEKSLIIFGIGLFFTLCALHSLNYIRKKCRSVSKV